VGTSGDDKRRGYDSGRASAYAEVLTPGSVGRDAGGEAIGAGRGLEESLGESTWERIPLFPLGVVLFPGMLLPLHLFEKRYRRLIEERQGKEPIFGVVLTRQGREVGDRPEIHDVGTAAALVGVGRYPDGRFDVVVRGTRRFRVEAGDWASGYLTAWVSWLDAADDGVDPGVVDLARQVSRAYEQFLAALERATGVELEREELGDDPSDLAHAVCARLPLNTWERQRLLEEPGTGDRLRAVLTILRRERALLVETGAGGAPVERPGMGFLAN
jgi:hypothetical protein